MTSDDVFDVIVMGAGPVGRAATARVVRGGLSAVVVERRLVGGECGYYGRYRQRLNHGRPVRYGRHGALRLEQGGVGAAHQGVVGRVRARGVRVNAVSPGPTRTEGTAGMGEGLDQLASLAPAGRPASPQEIASAIVYLASDQASFVHGAVLAVDGGRAAT